MNNFTIETIKRIIPYDSEEQRSISDTPDARLNDVLFVEPAPVSPGVGVDQTLAMEKIAFSFLV